LAHQYKIPVLINQDITLINLVDGIHFDEIPADFAQIKQTIYPNKIIGITCGNDFSKMEWAVENNLHYLSFCSVFPSKSVNTCELVSKEMISKTRAYTKMPIFLSGGIDLNNLDQLKETGLDGIAVISGIMATEQPEIAAAAYKQALINFNN
jgi:thiamine-phosphate pyrophosphorylase